jgi:hypothetical protein
MKIHRSTASALNDRALKVATFLEVYRERLKDELGPEIGPLDLEGPNPISLPGYLIGNLLSEMRDHAKELRRVAKPPPTLKSTSRPPRGFSP